MKYASAPYNFIPFDEVGIERYKSIDEIPKHNSTDKKLLSGEITYELVNETPIFVGEAQGDDFFTLPKVDGESEGKKAIPASTIKGLIRSNMQILGKGFFKEGEDFVDITLLYRFMFGKGELKKNYEQFLGIKGEEYRGPNGRFIRKTLIKNVKAGYIKKKGDDFYILETELDDKLCNEKSYGKGAKVSKEGNYFKISRESSFPIVREHRQDNNKFIEVRYKLDSQMLNVVDIRYKNGSEHLNGYLDGYLVIPGEIKAKNDINGSTQVKAKQINHMFIFPIWNEAKEHKIEKDTLLNYENDYKQKKSTLSTEAQAVQCLPENGKIKPIFYVKKDDAFYFGYSKYIRIPYKKSVSCGIPEGILLKDNEIKYDYARAMLGFTNNSRENNAFASRVKFSHAVLKALAKQNRYRLTPGKPNLSNYFDYIVQDGKEIKTYSSERFKMRGVKNYWLKDFDKESLNNMVASKGMENNGNVIESGATFKGKIMFKNLAEDELGLLLWSLTLGKDKKQLIGKGKPFGMGRVRINGINLNLDLDNRYTPMNFFEKEQHSGNIEDYIVEYKKYVKKVHKIDLNEDDIIKDFLYIHSNVGSPDKLSKCYMSLDMYTERKKHEQKMEVNDIKCIKTIREFRENF